MLDKTIDSALLNLRRDLIRSGGDGLEHVEALLGLRGVAMTETRYRKPDHSPRGLMTQLVLGALRDGPKTQSQISVRVLEVRPELTPVEARIRCGQTLARLKGKGLVGREGRVWRLAL